MSADWTLFTFWASVICLLGSLGLAFNTLIVIWIALFTREKVMLDFNRYHELWFHELWFHELWFLVVFCTVIFVGGVFGALWLALN